MLLDLTLGDVTGLWFVLPGWVGGGGGGGNGHHMTLSCPQYSADCSTESAVQLTASSVSVVSVRLLSSAAGRQQHQDLIKQQQQLYLTPHQ